MMHSHQHTHDEHHRMSTISRGTGRNRIAIPMPIRHYGTAMDTSRTFTIGTGIKAILIRPK